MQLLQQPNWRDSIVATYINGANAALAIMTMMGTPPGRWDKARLAADSLQIKARLQFYSKRSLMHSYTSYMDALIVQSKSPYAMRRQGKPQPGDPFTELVASLYDRGDWNLARHDTWTVLLITTLALRAYELEHGRLPEKLSGLVRAHLKQVPTDPFGNGEPVRYRRTGNSYRLWSIGPDGVDDNGTPIEDTTKPGRGRYLVDVDSQGDVVADVNQ